MTNRYYGRRGQMLAEAAVALSILTVAFLGVFGLLSRSLHFSRLITEQQTATYLALEGIEIVRSALDENIIKIIECPARTWDYGFADGRVVEVDFSTHVNPPDILPAASPEPNVHYLRFEPATGRYGYGVSGNDSIYARSIESSHRDGNPDYLMVTSTVLWRNPETGNLSRVSLNAHFLNWRQSASACP